MGRTSQSTPQNSKPVNLTRALNRCDKELAAVDKLNKSLKILRDEKSPKKVRVSSYLFIATNLY